MRRVLAIVIVVGLAAVLAFVVFRSRTEDDAPTSGVEKRLAAGDVAAARAERESIRGSVDAGWNDYLDGIFLLTEGKYHEAADVLERARRAHPDSWRITAAAVSAIANDRRFPEALAALESYVATAPDDERGLVEVARFHTDDRFGPPDAAKALAALDRIAALGKRVAPAGDPSAVSDGTLHRVRAKAHLLAGHSVEAYQEAGEAVRAEPQNPEAWYLFGDAARLSKLAHADDALDAYKRAFTLAPMNRRYGEQFVMATLKLVVPGTEAQRFADAHQALDSMLRAAPDDATLLILKARLLARDERTCDVANEIYADLQKRDLPHEQKLAVLRNRGVLLYDFKVGGRPSPYFKDAYDLLKQYVDLGGTIDDELRDPWKQLQAKYAPK
jgi:tetratricopeptide (TPR) repeat protein